MNAPAENRRAFTLVEVLVSLAIFALAAVALSAAYLNVLNGYHNRDNQREMAQGWNLARIQVQLEPDRTKLESGGNMNLPDNGSVTWSVVIAPAMIADLFAVELTVSARASTEWTKTERLMLFRPEWSDAGERDTLREESRQRLERSQVP